MNVILVITDDQPIGTMEYMSQWTKEIAERGINFSQAFVTTPLCCPSRASIMTGKYAIHTGVWRNSMPLGGARAFDGSQNIGLWLQQAGYKTAFWGKYLNGYEKVSPNFMAGWDFYGAMIGATQYSNMRTNVNGVEQRIKAYSPKWVFEEGIKFIQQHAASPFLLVLTPVTPHLPSIPEPEDEKKFKDYRHAVPALFERNVSDKPRYIRKLPLKGDEEELRNSRIMQIRALQTIDRGLGDVMETLKKKEIYQNTTIIFISDNGYLFGEHRLTGKVSLYEEAIRVPAAISSPIVKQVGIDSTNFFLNIDIAPTILAIARASAPSNWQFDGINMLRAITERQKMPRDYFLLDNLRDVLDEKKHDPSLSSRVSCWGVRTHSQKYVEYVTGEKELYDLRNDPYEMNSLHKKKQYADTIAKFQQMLTHYKQAIADADKQLDIKAKKFDNSDSDVPNDDDK